jgi:hypothetical protein
MPVPDLQRNLSQPKSVKIAIYVSMIEHTTCDTPRSHELRACTRILEVEKLSACLYIKQNERGA